jgi:dihydroxyacid dehydratase/phosphogluconate dehydratase
VAKDLSKTLVSRKILELQGLNSRGSVDQIMKEVKKQGGLNAEIQSRIGHQLRAMYDDVVRQGVPDRFAELIRKLDGPEAATQTGGDTDKNNGGN